MPLVKCDASEMSQVFLNLIINAAHAITEKLGKDSDKKGKITISTRKKDKWARIKITDTGTGIPDTIIEKVFDPFFTTKEVGKGTGQGLAISRSVVVEKHNGKLEIESKKGKGTSFIIRIPL
jgi:signal transduction histidine kinase